jgi:hypothetical protein
MIQSIGKGLREDAFFHVLRKMLEETSMVIQHRLKLMHTYIRVIKQNK